MPKPLGKILTALEDVENRVEELREQIEDGDYEGAAADMQTLRDELDTLNVRLRAAAGLVHVLDHGRL